MNQYHSQASMLIAAFIFLCIQAMVFQCSSLHLYGSCKELKTAKPYSSSRYYDIDTGRNGSVQTVYCNFDMLCGSSDGWTRVGYYDMKNSVARCPAGFQLYESNGIRACGRSTSGCVSITFPSVGNYSEVCGRVHAYQYKSLDGVSGGTASIDEAYVDGVSITRGSPRQHIWTFIGALGENNDAARIDCPCSVGSSASLPTFVGNDYYCESGNPSVYNIYFTNDLLWDGQQCGNIETSCCVDPMLPHFYKDIGTTTDDSIELRVCSDGNPVDEDSRFVLYEIYVK